MSESDLWLVDELLASRGSPTGKLPESVRWVDLDEQLLLAGGRLCPGEVSLPVDDIARLCRWRMAGLHPLIATCTRPPSVSEDEARLAAIEIDCLTAGTLDAIRIVRPGPLAMETTEVPRKGAVFTQPDQPTLDRMGGGLLGLAVGDALGAPIENMPAEKVARLHGPFRDFVSGRGWGPGYPTRETIQALVWFRELANGRTVHDAEDRTRLGRILARWVVGRPRDFGHLTRAILEAFLDTPPIPAAWRIWNRADRAPEANAALSRAVSVGIALPKDQSLRWASAIVASAMTHPAPVCLASALSMADVAAALIRGDDPFVAATESVFEDRTLAAIGEVLTGDWSPGGTGWSSSGRGHVLQTLRSALWALRQPCDLEETLLDLVHRGGDADTHGAIAGALLGARDGREAIPERWLDGLKVRSLVENLIRRRQVS